MRSGKVTLFPLFKQVAEEVAEEFKPGDVVSHKWLNERLELEQPKGKVSFSVWDTYKFKRCQAIEGLKDILLKDHRIFIDNIKGEGYLVVPAGDQAQTTYRKARKDFGKTVRQAEERLLYTQMEELTMKEKQEHDMISTKFEALRHLHKVVNRSKNPARFKKEVV